MAIATAQAGMEKEMKGAQARALAVSKSASSQKLLDAIIEAGEAIHASQPKPE